MNIYQVALSTGCYTKLYHAACGAAGPNPSLEPTRYGKAPWPRGAQAYLAPRGQGALPPRAAQLKR